MVRYFYAWIPVVVVTTVSILALPWLGLIALMVALFIAIAALGALAWAIVSGLHALSRFAFGLLLAARHAWMRSDAPQPLALNAREVVR
jgi:hypothetical protein